MHPVTLQRVLIFLRLAIVLSLAGYSLPAVNAAMHGSASSAPVVQSESCHIAATGHHSHDHETGCPDEPQKTAKQDCCDSYCVSMAIMITAQAGRSPLPSSPQQFLDDRIALGQLPVLHRPPNI